MNIKFNLLIFSEVGRIFLWSRLAELLSVPRYSGWPRLQWGLGLALYSPREQGGDGLLCSYLQAKGKKKHLSDRGRQKLVVYYICPHTERLIYKAGLSKL